MRNWSLRAVAKDDTRLMAWTSTFLSASEKEPSGTGWVSVSAPMLTSHWSMMGAAQATRPCRAKQ